MAQARVEIASTSAPNARRRRLRRIASRVVIYGLLLSWAFVALFPIYWVVTTSFKVAADITSGHILPWIQYQPDWRGWGSLGLSPDSIREPSTSREEFFKRFENSIIMA